MRSCQVDLWDDHEVILRCRVVPFVTSKEHELVISLKVFDFDTRQEIVPTVRKGTKLDATMLSSIDTTIELVTILCHPRRTIIKWRKTKDSKQEEKENLQIFKVIPLAMLPEEAEEKRLKSSSSS